MLDKIDFAILVVYFSFLIGIGLWAKRRASQSMDGFFLGGRRLPWYFIGISGLASYLDMSGTMLQTSFFYMLGAKGYWVSYRGAVVLFLAFLMIFLAKWLNRTKVMTIAEFMELRFGDGKQGRIASIITAVSVLMIGVAIVAFIFIGTGKFLHQYIPFLSPDLIGIILFTIALIYTATAGFSGVVYTDIFQSVLIITVIVFVSLKAFAIGTPEYFAQYASPEWRELMPKSWSVPMPEGYENMRMLGVLILFWIVSNVAQGFSVPYDSMTAQKYFAARNERESSLVAFQWIVLLSLRFLMMMGIGVLGISIAAQVVEPEMVLPATIDHFFPAGLKGLFIAALIAAMMSTFAGMVNSSAAYFVQDIYKKLLKPNADEKHYVRVSSLTTISIVVIGVLIGRNVPNINAIWAWYIMGLITGMLPAHILKWFWWRFNGVGYAWGMASGLLASLLLQLLFESPTEYVAFLFVIAISTLGTILGCLTGKPTDQAKLLQFYKQVRPFGFWDKIRKQCDPAFIASVNKENRRDLLLLFPACVWQLTLFYVMIAFMVKRWDSFAICLGILVVTSWILYQYWYKNLEARKG